MLHAMLDTNLCIRVIRDRPATVRDKFQAEAGHLAISTVVLYELHTGVMRSDDPQRHGEALEDFLTRLEVLPFDDAAAYHAGEIRADLMARGQIIGPNDLLIAGHARSAGLKLITGNLREFTRVDGLRCEDWF